MCEISIIVPVYKVEPYLRKCVDSILAQTFTDFEVILVDDGSPDNSGKICDEYASKDSRVRVIHKKNGGLSSARNAGIDVARGKYLGFVDSDDYIEKDMYELLYDNIVKEQADLSICGVYDLYANREPKILTPQYMVLSKIEAMKMILEAKVVSVQAWNKLYKKEIFDTIRYPEGVITEDAAVILPVLDKTEKVVIDTQQKYYYFHRENSITSSRFGEKDLDTINVWKENEIWIKERHPELSSVAHTRTCWAHFIVLDKIVISNRERNYKGTKEILNFLRSNYFFILKNQYFTRNRKIAATVLQLNVRLYKKLAVLEDEKYKSKNS
ncbi:glycosyl transferase family 2 [Enterococcus faecium]|uniref:glycosyltransferase family 2 protein n=1 Tax=Enterococcus faecium TaxID=1352 RepID=UPI000CF3117E|nr:glycosyltransferase [Enterococcus faecium]EGP5645524.1 glycosyltransferase [Enterococcus faecium]PQG97993.1 glycosyl transferase family 2 [Enterococcus faecium]